MFAHFLGLASNKPNKQRPKTPLPNKNKAVGQQESKLSHCHHRGAKFKLIQSQSKMQTVYTADEDTQTTALLAENAVNNMKQNKMVEETGTNPFEMAEWRRRRRYCNGFRLHWSLWQPSRAKLSPSARRGVPAEKRCQQRLKAVPNIAISLT